ncbi:MAG: dihydrodipicolinate synthase family protein [Burkholderiaceae bacterium]|jgi:4-hydroxy-tetrahydrodipicolinate synthase
MTVTPIDSALPPLLAPVLTPFDSRGEPDHHRLKEHCQWLLSRGSGLAVFGTNSEGNSMSVRQKRGCLDFLVEQGLPAAMMMPGTGACSVDDAVHLSEAAFDLGVGGVLMLPPFYYKAPTEDGLFTYFSQVIEKIKSPNKKIYVYNIPQVSHIEMSVDLLERLVTSFPGVVVGMKDSSGDWPYTQACIQRLKPHGFRVYAGSEQFLLQGLKEGGVGCISATANINPLAISNLANSWQDKTAETQQLRLNEIRQAFQKFPMIAAMKSAIADSLNDDEWRRLQPPLAALKKSESEALRASLEQINFKVDKQPGR